MTVQTKVFIDLLLEQIKIVSQSIKLQNIPQMHIKTSFENLNLIKKFHNIENFKSIKKFRRSNIFKISV